MSYDPFLIAPYSFGLDIDMEPWLLPEDAFSEITNGHISHGRIEKRQGYFPLAETAETTANYAITAATATDPVQLTLTDVTGLNNGDRIQINYVDGMGELNGNQYLVSNVAGGAGGTLDLQDLNGNDVDGQLFTPYVGGGYVSTFPGERIMGIARTYNSAGDRNTVVWDTARGYFFNKTNQSLEPFETGDIFDGGKNDFIHWNTWSSSQGTASDVLNRIYFTNGKAHNGGLNGVRFYNVAADPTTTQTAAASLFRPFINNNNRIDGAKFIFAIRQRLLLLGTVEGGTDYPQRARWCQSRNPGTPPFAGTDEEWDDNKPGRGGFVDAPTSEQIVTARNLQDMIIVLFTDSVWALRPNSDPRLPFIWQKLNSFRGADARMASFEFDRYVMSISQRGISVTDGNETKQIDDRVQTFVNDLINSDEIKLVNIGRNFQLKRTWVLYPNLESEEISGALIIDDNSGAFSLYTVAMNVLGYAQRGLDLALDDFPNSPTSLNKFNLPIYMLNEENPELAAGDETLQSFHWEANDELFVGGSVDGFIHQLDSNITDNGTNFEFSVTSAGWNPYKAQGQQSELGYVDFYLDGSPNTDIFVQFFKDDEISPYKTAHIDTLTNLKEVGGLSDVYPISPSTTGYNFESARHGLSTGDKVYFYGIEGPEFLNGIEFTASVVNDDRFQVLTDFSGRGTTITAITQANPGVVTAAGHPFENGDQIIIAGGDMTEVVGNVYTVSNATVNTFELLGIDTTGFTAYTGGSVVFFSYVAGGVITELPYHNGKLWRRAHGGGVGYVHQIKVIQSNNPTPLRIHAFMPHFKKVGRRMI